MKNILASIIVVLILMSDLATPKVFADSRQDKAQVIIMGVFHFRNPGKDVVKTDVIDVMTKANQAYLEILAKNINQFKPSKVLLEYNPKNQSKIQTKYNNYLTDNYQLEVNEIYQIGFRVAKLAGLKTVSSFDEPNVAWLAGPMFEHMKAKDKAMEKRFNNLIKSVEQQQNKDFATLTLKELLIKYNQKDFDDLNKSLYVMTNSIQEGEQYFGADASASWWHRNFRMYAKLQAHAQPGERILVIAGQGHTAILKDFLALDEQIIAVDVKKYF